MTGILFCFLAELKWWEKKIPISAAISSFPELPQTLVVESNILLDFYSLPSAQTRRQTPMLIHAELRNPKKFLSVWGRYRELDLEKLHKDFIDLVWCNKSSALKSFSQKFNSVTEKLHLKWKNTPPESFDRIGEGLVQHEKTKRNH